MGSRGGEVDELYVGGESAEWSSPTGAEVRVRMVAKDSLYSPKVVGSR